VSGAGRGSPITPGGDLLSGTDKAVAVRAMFDRIAPRYDLVNRVMTLRLDVAWRRRAVAALELPPGSVVVDIATGTGDLCTDLQSAGHRPLGIDYSLGMLMARTTSAPVLLGDALAMPLPAGSVDGATCGFALRNFVDLVGFFGELARVVRDGGRIALLDASRPEGRLARAGHAAYFGWLVPRIGALMSDRDAYRYLPRSLSYLPEPPEMLAALEQAGFADLDRRLLTMGAAQLITATRTRPRPGPDRAACASAQGDAQCQQGAHR